MLSHGQLTAAYSYDGAGNLQGMRYGNGVTNLCQYDTLNRLTNLVWNYGGVQGAGFAYQLKPGGTRTNLAEYINYLPSPINQSNSRTYDYLYRLTGETMGSNSQVAALNYTYDNVGNRLNRTATGVTQLPTTSYSYNTKDTLTADGAASISSDYDGNINTGTAGQSYNYDDLDRLATAGPNGISIYFDGDDTRVVKEVNSSTVIYYLTDDHNPSGYPQVLEEYTEDASHPSGTLSRVYNYGLNLISQQQFDPNTLQQSTLSYYGYDGHGNVRFLMDTNGTITDTYTYDAFGTLIASNGTTPTNYLYCGQQYDPDFGLYYNRARYLNTDTGIFLSMDTFAGNNEDPLSLHKYLYAQDDPVDHVDPSGHDIGDLLAVADIFTSFSAMILPVTSVATVLGTGQSTRPLTSGEISLAQTIYGGNIDYTKSGVNYGKFIFFQPKGREMTPNGVIYTGGVTIADYSVAGSRPAQYKDPKIEFGDQKAVFIHEMCHVWQYQHGKDVELRAALYRNYAYADVNFGTKSFDTYGMEQEAEMVQDYYYLTLDPPLHNWSMPDPVPPKSTYEKVIPFLPKK